MTSSQPTMFSAATGRRLPGLPPTTEAFVFATGPLDTNCYVFVDRSAADAEGSESAGRATVIDPGMGAKATLDALAAEHNFEIEEVVLTHGHIDHIRDAGALGVPVWVHALDRFFVEEDLRGSPLADLFDVASMTPPADIRELGEKQAIGGVEFDVHHTPGHSPGHVMFHTDGLVIGGDVLFRNGVGRVDLPGCSPEDMLLTLKFITNEFDDADVVLTGHGPHTTMGSEKRTNSFLRSVT